jgi:uncharacterized protein YqeY
MLINDIQKRMQDSMKARDSVSVDALRFILSQINYEKIEKGNDLTDEDVLKVIAREVKKRKESIEMFKTNSRNDLVQQEEKQLAVISSYLPKEMSEEEIKKTIQEIMSGIEDKSNIGKVMGAVMGKMKGKADGGVVAKVVKELLRNK